jgi:ferredoxin
MSNNRFSDFRVKFIKLTFKSRFLFAKTIRKIHPVSKLFDKLLFEDDDIQVIPRNTNNTRNIDVNIDIPTSEETIVPNEVLKKMIRRSKYNFIMDFCICRVSADCDDYPHELGCLFLGKGVNNISNKFGRMVDSKEAIDHVDRCYEAGLVHIIGRNKIDSIWLNTGPKEDLLSICHCCPCCCLWKMVTVLPEDIADCLTPMEGVKIRFNSEHCVGCGNCADDICFVNAITIHDKKAVIDSKICRVCGRCAEICSNDALTVYISSDAVDRSVERIEKLVDVESSK